MNDTKNANEKTVSTAEFYAQFLKRSDGEDSRRLVIKEGIGYIFVGYADEDDVTE